jgi:hypothetical protein
MNCETLALENPSESSDSPIEWAEGRGGRVSGCCKVSKDGVEGRRGRKAYGVREKRV